MKFLTPLIPNLGPEFVNLVPGWSRNNYWEQKPMTLTNYAMSYKSDMFEIENKSINGQYQFLCDRKLRITWHRQNRKIWSRVPILRHGPIFHLHIIKIWQMKKHTHMHFEEESIIYIWSKFQIDTCMFDSNILLTKFGPGFWSRVPGIGPGFYSFPGVILVIRYIKCDLPKNVHH